ncbi:response regulator [Dyadobacter bucti]|uniref:response regulator n=1 Tax=Dyadobacter bucti TaxID=2572203 RepID=UPI00110864BF|nr:response regulator [Dyadobacter bucti]
MNKIKVAIVENDEDERFFMVQSFGGAGTFELIGEFGNGDQLFDWLANAPQVLPQLIVTDLNMPGKNGYDVICEVAAHYPQIQVIATSTSFIPATREKCQRMGAREFLLKPDVFIDYDSFVSRVYELVKDELVKD